jgi:lipopolysaccharide export system protein LptA
MRHFINSNIIVRLTILTLLLITVVTAASSAVSRNPVHLKRADLMRTEMTPDGSVRYLNGNVWITQDTLSITGDQAIYYEGPGQLVFTGNVHFTEPTRQMWADQATYFEKDGHADAQGNVRIEQDSLTLTSDRAVYQEQRQEVNMVGHVVVHSLKDRAILTGGHGLYDRPDGQTSMEQEPRLVHYLTTPDSLPPDSMVVTGKLIEYAIDKKQAMVTKEVHIQRQDFDAWGEKLNYYNDGAWARLTGQPRMQRKLDTMQADTIDAFFKDNVLQRVHLSGKAVATSPADSLAAFPVNVINGKQMDVIFLKSELDSLKVRGNAASVYYVRQDKGESGANRVSGDAIDMKVIKGQITWVYVEGGTEGVYFPKRWEGLAQADQPSQNSRPLSTQPKGPTP